LFACLVLRRQYFISLSCASRIVIDCLLLSNKRCGDVKQWHVEQFGYQIEDRSRCTNSRKFSRPDMSDEGGVDERGDWVGGEGEDGGHGDTEDVHGNPIKPEPTPQPSPCFGRLLLVCVLPLSLRPLGWQWLLLLDDVRDDRLPTTTASRGTPPRNSVMAATEGSQ